MAATLLLTALAVLVILLLGAVYSALVIAHKTDEMIGRTQEEPPRLSVRHRRAAQRSVLDST